MRYVIRPFTQDAAPLGAYVNYLHAIREDERVALARKIHDELGGLLVSAAMDLGWAESRSSDVDICTRLRRLGINLATAIDMNRNIIEDLRPTLLDHFGLFEALRWYFKHECHHAEAICSDSYPVDELALTPSALSNVFRASQTLLDCTFIEPHLKSVDLEASIEEDRLIIQIRHEHVGVETVDVLSQFRHELESAAHRVLAYGGQLSFESHDNGLAFCLSLPLSKVRLI